MNEPQEPPPSLTREEMQRRWKSSTPRERRAMMRQHQASERDTPEGAARDRRRKAIVYSAMGLIIAGGVVYQLVTQ